MSAGRRALMEAAFAPARVAAYGAGEYVGQESFMRASEILSLAVRADVGRGSTVLDLCCGVSGPGALIVRELGCAYLGVDACPEAVDLARRRAGPTARFEVAQIPPLPGGRYDVVLLLETLLAFPDKPTLLRAVSSALAPGGRFAFTVEEGAPLDAAERAAMPAADTVWPIPLDELVDCLSAAGLRVSWQVECTQAHQAVARSLVQAFASRAEDLRGQVGQRALDEVLVAHELWSDWLRQGRIRKFALVAQR